MKNLVTRKPKASILKFFLWFLVSLFGLIVLSFFLLNILFADKLKSYTQQSLSQYLNKNVKIEQLSFSVLKGISVEQVSVSDETNVMLFLESASVLYNPVKLIQSDLVLKISVHNLKFYLNKNNNNFLPYYKEYFAKFNSHNNNPNLQLHIQNINADHIFVYDKNMVYQINSISFLSINSQQHQLAVNFNLENSVNVNINSLIDNQKVQAKVQYTILNEQYKKYIQHGIITTIISNQNKILIHNEATGPYGQLVNTGVLELTNQLFRLITPKNYILYKKNKIFIKGKIQNFQKPVMLFGFQSKKFDLHQVEKTISGKLQFDMSVKYNEKILFSGMMKSKQIFYSPLSITITKVRIPIKDNKILKGFFQVEQMDNTLQCKIVNSSDLMKKQKKINVSLSAGLLDLDKFQFSKITNSHRKTKLKKSVDYFVDGDIKVQRIKFKKHFASSLSGIFTLSPNISQIHISKVIFSKAKISTKAIYKNKTLTFSGTIRNYNLWYLFTQLKSNFSGNFMGEYSPLTKKMKINGFWKSPVVQYEKLKIKNYKLPWKISNNLFSFTNAIGQFYSGKMVTSGQYNLKKQMLTVNVSGHNISAKELFREYIKDETQKISGKINLNTKLFYNTKSQNLNIDTILNLNKGIIKNTDIQQKIGNLLSSDTINYIFYDNIKSEVQITKNKLTIEKFNLKAHDIEFGLIGTYNFVSKKRDTSMNFLLSNNFVKNLPNVFHLPITAVSKKNKKWYSLFAKETNNKIFFLKKK